MASLRVTFCLLLLSIGLAALPQAAAAANNQQQLITPTQNTTIPPDAIPEGFKISGFGAEAIADLTPTIQRLYKQYPDILGIPLGQHGRWEVIYTSPGKKRLLAEIDVDPGGKVVGQWSGLSARALFARGGFGRLFDSPLVWLPFGLLFLAPFFDPKRPFRLLHLDLVAFLSFGVSYAFFAHARPEAAIWSFYPVLAYFLIRMLAIGFGKASRGTRGPIVPLLPTAVLAVGLIALTGARVGLNLAQDKTVDVGFASVVGADRIMHGLPLYVDNEQHGDTYGPLGYVAYVPFEAIFPNYGTWDYLAAAHAAAIFFDLMTILGLFLLGRQMRAGPEGRRLGLALAWAWAAFPFTLFELTQSSNDGLIAMLFVYSLLALRSPAARGALTGVAASAKFIPGIVLPVLAFAGVRSRTRDALTTVVAAAVIFIASVLVYLPAGGLREFWNCTLGYQLGRDPDFSAWGITYSGGWTQTALMGAAIALLVVVTFGSRNKTLAQSAALMAAVTIAFQIPAGHWFYFYIVWFVPTVFVALFAPAQTSAEPQAEPRASAEPDFPTHRFATDVSRV